jgi:hypothetical protein
MKNLVEKVAQEQHDDETSRKTKLDTYLENATCLFDGMMNSLHQQTSALTDETAVNDALSQEHQDLIMKTRTNMVQTSVDGQDAENFFIGICSMAVCQWRIQHEALMSLSPQRGPSSVYYNNSGDDSPHQGQSSTPEDDKGHMSNTEVMRLLAEQQARSSDMMMAMMTQMNTNHTT